LGCALSRISCGRGRRLWFAKHACIRGASSCREGVLANGAAQEGLKASGWPGGRAAPHMGMAVGPNVGQAVRGPRPQSRPHPQQPRDALLELGPQLLPRRRVKRYQGLLLVHGAHQGRAVPACGAKGGVQGVGFRVQGLGRSQSRGRTPVHGQGVSPRASASARLRNSVQAGTSPDWRRGSRG
jgi:hypothetical protein